MARRAWLAERFCRAQSGGPGLTAKFFGVPKSILHGPAPCRRKYETSHDRNAHRFTAVLTAVVLTARLGRNGCSVRLRFTEEPGRSVGIERRERKPGHYVLETCVRRIRPDGRDATCEHGDHVSPG